MISKFKTDLTIFDALYQALIWFFLSLCTLGIAMMIFPYYFSRFILNRTFVLDENGEVIGRISCEIRISQAILRTAFWAIISILTLGLGYIVFGYKVWAYCLESSTVRSPAIK